MNRIYICKGEKVYYENKECIIIRIIDLETVSIEEINTHIIHTVHVNVIQPNQIGLPINNIHSLSEKEWDKACKRYEIIKPILKDRGNLATVENVALKNKISIPTLYRWLKLYDETGLVSSLTGSKKTGGIGKSRLTKAQDEVINDKIHSIYLNKSRKSIKKTILEIQLGCNELGITSPHSNTIRNRIKNISEEERVRKRLGVQEARYKIEPLKGHFPGADYPLSVIQIDHTPVDIILVDEEFRKPYRRPWITVAIDVYSRMVVGFYLSYETPGALGTGICVANSILPKEIWLEKMGIEAKWPCWGIMDVIHVDNAKEFHGNMLKKACLNYGINIKFRPIGSPHWGGHIERLMGTFAKEIHNLPGTTFSSEAERKNYQSEKNASFTLNEFEKWITIYITKIYHTRIHSSLGKSPLDKFEEGIMGTDILSGRGIPPRIFNETRVRLDFMPYVERSIQEYGVVIDHIYYYDDILRPYIHSLDDNKKRKYIFKRDPRDISVVFFYDPLQDSYFEIPYRNTSLPPISIWEQRDILKKLQENRKNINEDAIFEAYRDLNEIESRAIRSTKKLKHSGFTQQQIKIEDTNKIEVPIVDDIIILPFDDIEDEAFK